MAIGAVTTAILFAVAMGATPLAAVSVAALASALMMFVGLRGHFAWPLFLLAGLFGLHGEGWLGEPILAGAAAMAAVLAGALAALHVYWALGGPFLIGAVIPTTPNGRPVLTPGRLATMAVAGLLAGFAGLVALVAATDERAPIRWLLLVGIAVLAVRAVGDGRQIGFSKQHRSSRFAENDDRFFTPIVVFLAVSSAAALLI